MISREDYIKEKAVEILRDRVESRMARLGDIAPNVRVRTFAGEELQLFDLLKENHLILSFMRGSW